MSYLALGLALLVAGVLLYVFVHPVIIGVVCMIVGAALLVAALVDRAGWRRGP